VLRFKWETNHRAAAAAAAAVVVVVTGLLRGDRSAETGCGHNSWTQGGGGGDYASNGGGGGGSIHDMNAAQRCVVGADVANKLYEQSGSYSNFNNANPMDRSGAPAAVDNLAERAGVAAAGCAQGVFNPGAVEAAQQILK